MSIRQKYNDMVNQRKAHLDAAQAALDKGNRIEYQSSMDKAKSMNQQLEDMKALIDEDDRYARNHAPKFGPEQRDMEEMGRALKGGEAVRFNVAEVLSSRQNSTTLATGTLTAPQGTGTDIRDGFASQVSGLIDQVNTIDLTGLTSYEEPYVVSELPAQSGKVSTNAGKLRTDSDPTFAKAKLSPYEVTVTSYVDRNLGRLNPANYAEKVRGMALRALRRKVNDLIINGDGQAAPDMFGILNAKNTSGTAIFASEALGTALDIDSMNTLVYAYGGSEELGGNARLILTKTHLQALCKLRGTNEKRNLFKASPDAGNANQGVIEGDGLIVPYTIASAIGNSKLAYGDPFNYELALFGDYTIRLDESYKAGERLDTILGDIMCGGNLVVDKGFVVGTIGAASSGTESGT